MRSGIIVVFLCALGALGGSGCDVDPCPGKLTCKNKVCCPIGYPFECGGQCYATAAPCGGNAIECKPHGAGELEGEDGDGLDASVSSTDLESATVSSCPSASP